MQPTYTLFMIARLAGRINVHKLIELLMSEHPGVLLALINAHPDIIKAPKTKPEPEWIAEFLQHITEYKLVSAIKTLHKGWHAYFGTSLGLKAAKDLIDEMRGMNVDYPLATHAENRQRLNKHFPSLATRTLIAENRRQRNG